MIFCYNVSVTAERSNIKSVKFEDTIKVFYEDGSWTEYGYDLIEHHAAPQVPRAKGGT